MTLGSINHVALTVTDFEGSLPFFDNLLGFLGYARSEVMDHAGSGSRLAVYVNVQTGTAVNIWRAVAEHKKHRHRIYAPGLHHVAFNADNREQVDELALALLSWGGTLLEGPAEYPYDHDGYYAVYFTGPDGMKFECVHMPAEARHEKLR